MEERIGGTDIEIKKMYQKISLFKQNYYEKRIEFLNNDIIKTLVKAQNCLKKIDLIEMRSDIEMQRYHNATLPGFLWQEKYIAKFYFFVVMIGYIDGRIRENNRVISFHESFLWTKNNDSHRSIISDAKDNIRQLMKARSNVILDNNTITMGYDSFKELFDDVLNTCPSYLKFTNLYVDSEEHHLHLDLQQHLVTAYNIGFINWHSDYDKIMNKYQVLLSDYKIHQEKNQKKVAKEKMKTKKH